MNRQITDTVLMVRPDAFGFNPETAETNIYQHSTGVAEVVQKNAKREFVSVVRALRSRGIRVVILPGPKHAPDAIFPNWVTFHDTGTVVYYPMMTPNRRAELQPKVLMSAFAKKKLHYPTVIDLSAAARKNRYLEGWGSLVMDRVNKVVYAVESSRTSFDLVKAWAKRMKYTHVLFHALGATDDYHIYHTDLVMTIGDNFVVYCEEAVKNTRENKAVIASLAASGRTILKITSKQLALFCGNIVQLSGRAGKKYIVMSRTAYRAFGATQKKTLRKFGILLPVSIPTIEHVGGGSAHCMLTEVFYPSGK